jgi:hypothetical protein
MGKHRSSFFFPISRSMAKGFARIAFEKHTHTQLDRKFHPELYEGDDWFDKFYYRHGSYSVKKAAWIAAERAEFYSFSDNLDGSIVLLTDGWDSLKTRLPSYTRPSRALTPLQFLAPIMNAYCAPQMRRFLEPQMRTFLAPSDFFHGGARIQELVKCHLVVQEDPLQPLEGRVSVVLKVEEVLVYQTA